MPQRNEEPFENYLRRFEPRRPRTLPAVEHAPHSPLRWPVAAALMVLAMGLAFWNGTDPIALRTSGTGGASGGPGSAFEDRAAGFASIGRVNELLRRDPAQFDAQLTEASRRLLPPVEKPGGLFHVLNRE